MRSSSSIEDRACCVLPNLDWVEKISSGAEAPDFLWAQFAGLKTYAPSVAAQFVFNVPRRTTIDALGRMYSVSAPVAVMVDFTAGPSGSA